VLDGLTTERLRLVAADAALLHADLEHAEALAEALDAEVPPDWPPETWDEGAVGWLRERLAERPEEVGWSAAYLLRGGMLVGTVGLKGPPVDGGVEVGYSLVPSARGQGFATEAVRGVVAACRARRDIERVIAHTLEDGDASIAVLTRVGFRPDGPGEEPGTRRFVLDVRR
jgi:[ribosomal protein S5]-alanine N-acetyltransferase